MKPQNTIESPDEATPAYKQVQRNGASESFGCHPLPKTVSIRKTLENIQAEAEAKGEVVAKVHFIYPRRLREEVQEVAKGIIFPVLWTESDEDSGPGGVFIHRVKAESQRYLTFEGQPLGLLYKDKFSELCILSGIYGRTGDESHQTLEVFETIETLLADAGMDYSHVARTWFYNDDILRWYGDFNRVRTRFFEKHKVFDHLLPASTGIGAKNPFGAALATAVFAVRDTSGKCHLREVGSPLQCPATDYGSSFARAVRFDTPEHRRLTISGTASIDESGETVFVGDFEAQYHKTHEVIAAILEAEGFRWQDVVRGVAYFRKEEDRQRAENLPLPDNFPVIRTVNVVCRDDLLYELEINAVKSQSLNG